MKGVAAVEMAKVTSKGQITIPVSIRRSLGIKEGDKLLFIDKPNGVLMVNPSVFKAEETEEPSEQQIPAYSPDAAKSAAISPPPRKPPPTPLKSGAEFDAAAILNEIRSIGSKI